MPFVDREDELLECLQTLVYNKIACGPGLTTKTRLVILNQMFGSGKTTLGMMLTRLPGERQDRLLEQIHAQRGGQDVARRVLGAHYVLADLSKSEMRPDDLPAQLQGLPLGIKHYVNVLLYEAVNRSLNPAWSWSTSAIQLNGKRIL